MFEAKLKEIRKTYTQRHDELVAFQRQAFEDLIDSVLDDACARMTGNHRTDEECKIHINHTLNLGPMPVQPETEDLIAQSNLELKYANNQYHIEGYLTF